MKTKEMLEFEAFGKAYFASSEKVYPWDTRASGINLFRLNSSWIIANIHDEQVEEINKIKHELKHSRLKLHVKSSDQILLDIERNKTVDLAPHTTKVSTTEQRAYAYLRKA